MAVGERDSGSDGQGCGWEGEVLAAVRSRCTGALKGPRKSLMKKQQHCFFFPRGWR